MNDPTILFVKPNAIKTVDKKTLATAGVIVVEVDNPQDVKLVRAQAELSSTEMLAAAVGAIRDYNNSSLAAMFANSMMKIILAKSPKASQ